MFLDTHIHVQLFLPHSGELSQGFPHILLPVPTSINPERAKHVQAERSDLCKQALTSDHFLGVTTSRI